MMKEILKDTVKGSVKDMMEEHLKDKSVKGIFWSFLPFPLKVFVVLLVSGLGLICILLIISIIKSLA